MWEAACACACPLRLFTGPWRSLLVLALPNTGQEEPRALAPEAPRDSRGAIEVSPPEPSPASLSSETSGLHAWGRSSAALVSSHLRGVCVAPS